MEKVAGNYYSITPMATNSGVSQSISASSLEKSPAIRGHHSGVHKAVEAHRQMVEDRQSRKVRRDRGVDPFEAQQTNDLVSAQQIAQAAGGMGGDTNEFEGNLIEPIESEAKTAVVQAFQAQEPDRPFIGEPVPRGSYIDVQA